MRRMVWQAALATCALACTFPDVAFDDAAAGGVAGGGGSGGTSTDGGGGENPSGGGNGGGAIGGGPTNGGGGAGGGLTCIDADGDHFVDETSDAACADLPQYDGIGDCDDSDANAYPGQPAYFGSPRESGGFDYDCSNGVETLYPTMCSVTDQSLAVSAGEDGCGDLGNIKSAVAICLNTGDMATQLCH